MVDSLKVDGSGKDAVNNWESLLLSDNVRTGLSIPTDWVSHSQWCHVRVGHRNAICVDSRSSHMVS